MTAPADLDVSTDPAQPDQQRPEGSAPVSLVLAVEGIETSDGRYIEPGALTTRPMPLGLYAQVRSTHGADGDAATWNVGAITSAERVPGPSVTQRSTGEPFPEGTFVWLGKGWMYTDVPTPESGSKSAYVLVKDGALRGNSVDLSAVDAEFEYDTDDNGDLTEPIGNSSPRRIVMHSGAISSTTLVGIPAFMDAFIELDEEPMNANQVAELIASLFAERLEAKDAVTVPAWRSMDIGDVCGPCSANYHTVPTDDPWEHAIDAMANVPAEKRKRAKAAGHALPDGSYPIENEADLDNAISAVGRAGGQEGTAQDRNRVRRHIIKQAKRLKLADKIPDTWNTDGTLKTEKAGADTEPLADLLMGDDYDAPQPSHATDGMVALIPANPTMLTVAGGDPADQIHLTLAYLGEQVDTWTPEQVAAVHQIALTLTDWGAYQAAMRGDAAEHGQNPDDLVITREQRSKAHEGPLEGNVFAHAVFNPNGGPTGQEPATVYLLDGSADRYAIEGLASEVCYRVKDELGDLLFPEQHSPYVPHVTAGYNLDPAQLTFSGPVTFDRLRVAIGDQITDYPLGGGGPTLVASAATLPPLDWFEDPQLDSYTPITVTDDGQVYGHLATWGTCHVGFQGQCVTPPSSPSSYAYYRVHATRAVDPDGEVHTVPVGYATVGTGHAGPNLGALAAAEHYDNTGTAVMELAAGEDRHGIWVAGRLLPGLDQLTEHKARGITLSGDWRTVRGNLELLAALGVNTPGFPVPRVRVASGVPITLVAAGIPRGNPDRPIPGVELESLLFGYLKRDMLADLDADLRDACTYDDLAADLDADLLLVTDGDHPWLLATVPGSGWEFADSEDDNSLTAAGRKKIHLPPYIKRIAKHLQGKGMAEGRAIATARNAAKRMCKTGDLNFPGSQQVNPGSRAEACKADAQWKADRPGAR